MYYCHRRIAQQPAAPVAVFDAISELDFDQTASTSREAEHDQLWLPAGAG